MLRGGYFDVTWHQTERQPKGGENMAKVLIIGAGGVSSVVGHKCAQAAEVFDEIVLASRTRARCDAIAADVKERTGRSIETAQVDADNVPELVALIKRVKPQLVMNIALPYQDLHIMDACLEADVHYLDTANYEPPDTARSTPTQAITACLLPPTSTRKSTFVKSRPGAATGNAGSGWKPILWPGK